ncbi:MAG: MoaD/ThiS family protein [Gemmataceae bacterium]|nr:MoaD/ThiS family protein [Gemmataceae bacterium]
MNEILSLANTSVTIEFQGLARQKAGRSELAIPGQTLAQLLDHVGRTCPGLSGLLNDDGSISRK